MSPKSHVQSPKSATLDFGLWTLDFLSRQVFARAGRDLRRAASANPRDRRNAGDMEILSAVPAILDSMGLAAAATENLFPRPTERNRAAGASPSVNRRG